MDSDNKLQQFALLAKSARGRALVDLINRATAEPGVFAFGELLALPNVQEMRNGEFAQHFALLELFCYGTLEDHKAKQQSLPQLNAQQEHKLKQLTMMSLATEQKVLPYAALMAALCIPSVRALEDFLITECFYSGIVSGKLDQRAACLQVHDAASRDVLPSALPALSSALNNWLSTSHELLLSIEARINYAAQAGEEARKHRAKADKQQEEVRKNIKTELDIRSQEGLLLDEGSFDMMEEDRAPGARPKRRR